MFRSKDRLRYTLRTGMKLVLGLYCSYQ